MKVTELLSDESKWTRGRYAQDSDGNIISIQSNLAVCWCLDGALYRCYGRDTGGVVLAERRLLAAIKKLFPERPSASIPSFNDAEETTFADVLAVIKEAHI